MSDAAQFPHIPEGWVDLQVNGFIGVDFSKPGLDVESVRRVTRELVRRGTGAYCPTVITSPLPVYESNLPVLAAAMEDPELRPRLLGIHIEGPFLAPAACGAHAPALLRAPDVALFQQWQRLARGHVRLLTLAPELEGAESLVRHAVANGVVVSLGHHMADDAALERAIAAGARCCTHLGNGIPNTLPRHPNAIWSQMADDRLSSFFITDGHHLPASVVRVAWRAKGVDRFIVTSDAAAVAGLPPGRYAGMGTEVVLEPSGRLALASGAALAGSSATMDDCLRWLASVVDCTPEELRRVGRLNPLRLLAEQTGADAT